MPDDASTLTVVVITWNRPLYAKACLEHLLRSVDVPDQILVVDASADSQTRDIVAAMTHVTYIAFPAGAGHMTASRNEALRHADGEIVAFLDDDANVEPEWASALREAYADPSIAAAAGRTRNGLAGEGTAAINEIGRFLPDGTLTGNFAAAVDEMVDIDHGIGANMSFRRATLELLGGFRADYPGTALREDTDIFLRVRMLGLRSVFVPRAVVHHVGAPHVKGERFDRRYQFWGTHNHLLLLTRVEGLTSRLTWRWIGLALSTARHSDSPPYINLGRQAFVFCSLLAGLASSLRKAGLGPAPPILDSADARQLRQTLADRCRAAGS